jgi:plasmid stability protein
VENRNLTLSLPAELIRKAKVYAAEHDTTINTLVRELLDDMVSQDARERAAAAKLLELADHGPYFTADPGSIPRDELHERQ